MTAETRRDQALGLYVTFDSGAHGRLSPSPTWNLTGAEPAQDGTGLNVSAFGTLTTDEARELAAIIVAEADRIDAEA